MFKLALVVSATVVLCVHGQTSNYSAICANHTMVIYPAVGPKCAPLYASGVSNAEIATIVDKHNALRSKVAAGNELQGLTGAQPKAANMRNMTWDWELATIAQRWASQCDYGHDTCRNVARFWWVGQNVYVAMSTAAGGSAPWTAAIDAWYNEVVSFNKSNINPYKSQASPPVVGHYTQVAWADTYLVGCGYAYYKSSNPTYPYYRYTVCNYGPGGNVQGPAPTGVMYQIGNPCTQCPATTSCNATVSVLCK